MLDTVGGCADRPLQQLPAESDPETAFRALMAVYALVRTAQRSYLRAAAKCAADVARREREEPRGRPGAEGGRGAHHCRHRAAQGEGGRRQRARAAQVRGGACGAAVYSNKQHTCDLEL